MKPTHRHKDSHVPVTVKYEDADVVLFQFADNGTHDSGHPAWFDFRYEPIPKRFVFEVVFEGGVYNHSAVAESMLYQLKTSLKAGLYKDRTVTVTLIEEATDDQ